MEYTQQQARYKEDMAQWRKDFKEYQERKIAGFSGGKEDTVMKETVTKDTEMMDVTEGLETMNVDRPRTPPPSPLLKKADAWLGVLGEEIARR